MVVQMDASSVPAVRDVAPRRPDGEHHGVVRGPAPSEIEPVDEVVLNLVKNAAESVSRSDGEIILSTGYRHGVRLAVQGNESRVDLPIVVGVQDNGPGVPEDLRAHLFDPFVTTKLGGKGLGLALVAKIVGGHGGVIEFDSRPRRTVFRVYLPVSSQAVTSTG